VKFDLIKVGISFLWRFLIDLVGASFNLLPNLSVFIEYPQFLLAQ